MPPAVKAQNPNHWHCQGVPSGLPLSWASEEGWQDHCGQGQFVLSPGLSDAWRSASWVIAGERDTPSTHPPQSGLCSWNVGGHFESALDPGLSLCGLLSDHSGSCVYSVTLLEVFNARISGGVHASQLETPTEYRRLCSVTTACIKNHLWAGLTCHAAIMIHMERNSNRQMKRKHKWKMKFWEFQVRVAGSSGCQHRSVLSSRTFCTNGNVLSQPSMVAVDHMRLPNTWNVSALPEEWSFHFI